MSRLLTAAAVILWMLSGLMLFHRSGDPSVLGRYSADYAALLALVVGGAMLGTIARSPAVYRALRRVRVVPALPLILPLMVGFAATELVVRALDLFGSSYYAEIARFSADTLPDPELNYRLRPGLSDVYQGIPVALNELGLRERPLGPKRPGRVRVLLLGDSVTFGWGARVEDTFGRQLETRLPVETVNAGVPSYNSDVELSFLERHGAGIDPDAVVLTFVENDTDPTLPPPPQDLGTIRRFWTHPSASVRHVLHKSRVYLMFSQFVPIFVPAAGGPASGGDVSETPGWASAMTSLGRIAAWCGVREVPFMVVLYRMVPNARTDAQAASIAALARREQFDFVDALPWFEGRNHRALTVSFVDPHPNAEGHRILAEGIGARLIESGALQRINRSGRHAAARQGA